ncbi:hypothetical protein Salat_1006500 [Sesamum alatum]|uniref:Uncharacterized protein n=1 Tax=Sesamum alatum TaxID=300844 RepID=A0AAE1YLY1_9LAMI|nr:hypothetical protein Salat_1006500 [Sesamum alatum]
MHLNPPTPNSQLKNSSSLRIPDRDTYNPFLEQLNLNLMAKRVGLLMSSWMEVAPALVVTPRKPASSCPTLETITEEESDIICNDDDDEITQHNLLESSMSTLQPCFNY